MTTQPSDWAVARAFAEARDKLHRMSVARAFSEEVMDRARELDASGDAPRAAEAGAWRPMRECPADVDVLCLTKDGRQQVAMQDGPSSIFLDRNCHKVRPIAWMHLPAAMGAVGAGD